MASDPDQMTRAGNYVLGLMDRKERERAEHDLEIDPGFRDAVFRVAERMHMFDSGAAAAAAGKDDWSAVAARIAEMPQMRGTASDLTEAEAGRAGAIAPSPMARRKERPHRLYAFATGAAIGVALFAAGAAGYLLAPPASPSPPVLVAVLVVPDGAPGAVLEIGADRSMRLVMARDLAVPEGRSIALWTAGAPGGAQARIASVALAGSQSLRGADIPEPRAEEVYRLVLEPAAGETTPGTVLAEGAARPVLAP